MKKGDKIQYETVIQKRDAKWRGALLDTGEKEGYLPHSLASGRLLLQVIGKKVKVTIEVLE